MYVINEMGFRMHIPYNNNVNVRKVEGQIQKMQKKKSF